MQPSGSVRSGGVVIRACLLFILLLVPFALAIPADAGPVGNHYVEVLATRSDAPAEVQNTGIAVQGCSFPGQTVEIWEETNGVAGLQRAGADADKRILHVFATTVRNSQCLV